MKKIILAVSILIVCAFGIAALISLTPDSSRETTGNFTPNATPTPTLQQTATPTPSPVPDTPTPTPSPLPGTTPAPTPTPTPTPEVPTYLGLNGTTKSQEYKHGNKKIASISFFVPQIASNKDDEYLNKINNTLKIESNDLYLAYSAECQQLVDDYDPMSFDEYSYNSKSVMYYTDSIISIRMQVDISYGPGSGDQVVFCFNFSRQTGETLDLDDVITDKPALIDAAILECENRRDIEFTSRYENYISTKICNEWYVKDDCICLVYKPYEIASGVAGTIELSVKGNFLKIN